MTQDASDSQLMDIVVRMVVPMRREFGRSIDVTQFLHDFAYAREILVEALKSKDSRLVQYASYLDQHLHGPRKAAPPAAAPQQVPLDDSGPAQPARSGKELTAEEMRDRILKKYTQGLR